MPYTLIFIVLGLILYLLKRGAYKKVRFVTWFSLVSLYLLSLSYFSERSKLSDLAGWEGFKPANDTVDVAIVLGGFMESDSIFTYGVGGAFDRLLAGIRMVKRGQAKHLLLSGGLSPFENPPAEALLMKAFIDEFQLLPDSLILLETNSSTTFENAAYSAEILDSLHLSKTVFLCTSVNHMNRSKEHFENKGFTVLPVPVDFPVRHRSFERFPFYLIPNPHSLIYWSNTFREWMGYWFYRIFT